MNCMMVSVMTDEGADKLTLVIEYMDGSLDYVDMTAAQAVRVAGLLAPQARAYECLDELCFAIEQMQVFGDDTGVEVCLKAARKLLRQRNETAGGRVNFQSSICKEE
ncbi:hypothetical protein TSH7_01340 [Azospirillum sp. TSH7]|nr:hypothetical protein TSH7_01340 [Azospirillum sp. TSH7]PWC71392.1 hypothetical protein TSH20_03735 [Azospirillum sp. TSH20]